MSWSWSWCSQDVHDERTQAVQTSHAVTSRFGGGQACDRFRTCVVPAERLQPKPWAADVQLGTAHNIPDW